jgi:hypothetical protein
MSDLGNIPFSVENDDDGTVVIIHAEACVRPEDLLLADPAWVRQLHGSVLIDFQQVFQVNSAMVAWLFQIVQASPGPVTAIDASTRVRRQLKHFHLEHFMDFPTADVESGLHQIDMV